MRTTILITLTAIALAGCDTRRKPAVSIIAPTPNEEILRAAEAARAAQRQPAAPWLLIERTELAPARGTVVAAFQRDGADALPPERLVFHSATEPAIARDEGGVWRITFKP